MPPRYAYWTILVDGGPTAFRAAEPDELRVAVARETLALYSPLANRLGVWELKLSLIHI